MLCLERMTDRSQGKESRGRRMKVLRAEKMSTKSRRSLVACWCLALAGGRKLATGTAASTLAYDQSGPTSFGLDLRL